MDKYAPRQWLPHEKPSLPGSPSTPLHSPAKRLAYGVVGLLVAAIFTAEGILAWACWKLLPAAPRRRRVLQAWAVVALLMASGQVATVYYDARGDRDVIAQWNYLPWAQPITAKSFMRRLGVVSEQQVGLPDPRHAQLLYPLQPLRCQSPQRPNVLMVVLESLRHDALTPQTMPNTSALAASARVYDRHFSTGNATRYGLFGLLYGLPGGYFRQLPVLLVGMIKLALALTKLSPCLSSSALAFISTRPPVPKESAPVLLILVVSPSKLASNLTSAWAAAATAHRAATAARAWRRPSPRGCAAWACTASSGAVDRCWFMVLSPR